MAWDHSSGLTGTIGVLLVILVQASHRKSLLQRDGLYMSILKILETVRFKTVGRERMRGQSLQHQKYHNMKGKKEDDNSKPKSANESMRVKQFTDLLVHVELEQLSDYSKFQLNPVKEKWRA